ncbi:MAG: hypothetical protein IPP63_20625 [Chloracidobacterium sp.]|nr:hypothetical protein [Chloracidobacterium sp.]
MSPTTLLQRWPGYLAFTVIPTANQLTRTDIANTATIYFDDNEPLVTNATTNLIDRYSRQSVAALPATGSDPSFPIIGREVMMEMAQDSKVLTYLRQESGGVFTVYL